jgi:hypothetical protein
MTDCCGASLAATSCDTRLLTLMTEPPAAPELPLLATDTGVVVTGFAVDAVATGVVLAGVVEVIVVAILSNPLK